MLERDYPTSNQLAENKTLQLLEKANKLNYQLIEFTGNLQISSELQKAGWDSFAEIKRFIGDINLGLIKGLTLEEAVAFSTQVFTEHIRFYDAEFTRQESVLPHHNYFGKWQGEQRVLGNNGRPAVQAIDQTERMGAPRRSAGKAEAFLLQTDDNSVVVSMSAQGESGYLDENGKDIPHLNTYIMVDWKDQTGKLQGMTLVTDLTVDQAVQVMAKLGAPANFFTKTGSQMQRLVNLLENLATPTWPAEYSNPFRYVFDQVLSVRGEGDIRLKQKNGPDEVRSVAEIRQKIAACEAILDMDVTKARLIKEFQDFVLANYAQVQSPSFQQNIINMAEETVLLFAKYYRKHHQNSLSTYPPILFYSANHTRQDDQEIIRLQKGVDRRIFFAAEIAFLQTRAGCPSSSNLKTLTGASVMAGTSGLIESDSMGSLYFACPICGAINKRPREGYVNNCQSCGSDKVACSPSSSSSEKKQEKDYHLPKAA